MLHSSFSSKLKNICASLGLWIKHRVSDDRKHQRINESQNQECELYYEYIALRVIEMSNVSFFSGGCR